MFFYFLAENPRLNLRLLRREEDWASVSLQDDQGRGTFSCNTWKLSAPSNSAMFLHYDRQHYPHICRPRHLHGLGNICTGRQEIPPYNPTKTRATPHHQITNTHREREREQRNKQHRVRTIAYADFFLDTCKYFLYLCKYIHK